VLRSILTPFAAAAVLALAGCGGDDDNGSSSSTAAETPSTSASTPAAGGAVTVDMQNIAFDPKSVTVKVGQTIEWVNKDSVDHNVVATKGENFKSDTFGKDGTYKYTVDKAGTIDYVCTLHPGMEGSITVTK
jgi:plastocyanin